MPLPLAGLLASVGVPLLTKLVGGALGSIDHPAARGAAQALDAVDKAFDGGEISPEQVAEANRHAERMAAIEAERDTGILAEVNATMRAEAASDDRYVKRWRPTFGYVVAFTWGVQMTALSVAVVMYPAEAPALINAMVALQFMWGVALSVLGISVVKRSHDKQVAAGSPPEDIAGAVRSLFGRS